MLIFGLMLLLQTAACLDRSCSFGQSDPCNAALGDKLNLLMERDARKYDLKLHHRINNTQDDPICRVRNNRMKECDLYNNRPEVTVINGTVIINRVIRSDSGNYRLTLTESDGTETSRDLQVIVEAPIGSVNVSIICSSSGVMRVSCSSEGDQLLYNWTLNGGPLMDGNSSIDLDERTDGDISCSVKNHVSHAQKTIRVKHCPGPTTAAVTSAVTQTSKDGLEVNCSFDQSDHCYAALGDKLNLLMVDASKYDLKIIKRINNTQDDPVCRVKNGRMRMSECDLYNNRTEVTVINGTVIIKCVIRSDSGNYRLTLTDSDGTETSKDLQVIVEAPIGSVNVSIICSTSGVMRVSCSSEGDQLLYNWTLNGGPLMDGNSSIDLDERTDGDISCSVKNHVSHAQKTIRLVCPTAVKLYLIVLGCVALILILMFITVCYIYKRKQLKWTPAAAGGTELIYADISLEEKGEKKNTAEVPPYVDVEYAMVQLQTKRKEEEEVEEKEEVEENEEKEEVEKKEEKEKEENEVVEEKEQEEVEEEEEDVKEKEEEEKEVEEKEEEKEVEEKEEEEKEVEEKEEEEKEVGEELQYGEVTFTPNHSHNPQELQNQCVF
ncbi:uncharacterized protein LOC113058030 [Carassius auratus]|uniref:Uncharacterized protein LOC113058030 n=1 Tax=Carassius auratus TaxID=7957 RepID=A0A6P6LA86_CARAU|nr:uncharacterized protein LOC113058030 [Carassius auratus]